jgi:hypothetical protein
MNEAVQSAFAARGQTPGAGEGVTIARTITNELDSARFDPLLVRTVARNAVRVLEGMISRVDGLVSCFSIISIHRPLSDQHDVLADEDQLVKDFTATSLIGPHATPAQISNGALVGFLYHCQYNLLFIETEFPTKVWEIMQKTVTVGLLPLPTGCSQPRGFSRVTVT